MTKKEAQYVTGFSVLEKEMHAFLVKCMPFQSENEAHTGVGLAPGISVLQEGQQLVGNLSHFILSASLRKKKKIMEAFCNLGSPGPVNDNIL